MDNAQPSLIYQLRHGILAKPKKDCQFIYSGQRLDSHHCKNTIMS
jgi:hypothetical protein